jgi:short subunit dehydrogenase-like uncharacterized protein
MDAKPLASIPEAAHERGQALAQPVNGDPKATPTNDWLLYGATGYTGQLIAEAAAARGLRPVLAGRDLTRVSALADRLGLPGRVFGLEDPKAVREGLRGIAAVLHCAGPFAKTAPAMLEACLATGVHYLDITGEIEVFRLAHEHDGTARQRGIAVLPGMGFDVVPSDCLAALLARRLPQAVRLTLAFEGEGGASPGTAKTAFLGLLQGGMVRRGGRLERVPVAAKVRYFVREGEQRLAALVPWGDVYTAHLSTGIPDIEVYMVLPPKALRRLRGMRRLAPLLALPPLRRWLLSRIEKRVRGPDERERTESRAWLWGEVEDAQGRRERAMLITPNGYALTAEAALAAVTRLLAAKPPLIGFHTPSRAFGADFALRLPGVEWRAEWSPSG